MALLVVGFVISALTTRSGVQVTITGEAMADRARLLTVPPGTIMRDDLGATASGKLVQIEVLNGCGIPGVANQFTDHLRNYGFDVVRFTNAQRYDYPRTLVVNRGTDFTHAQAVAQFLGVEPSAVENLPDPALQLDVTVVVGQDYASLIAFRDMQSSAR